MRYRKEMYFNQAVEDAGLVKGVEKDGSKGNTKNKIIITAIFIVAIVSVVLFI